MSARTWVNGGPPALSAANLNALEADVVAAASAAAAAQAAIPTGLARNIAVDGATTGSANNATIIQAAINAVATAGGGEVRIPKGTWLTGPLKLKTRVKLKGEDFGSQLKLINGANAHLISLNDLQVEQTQIEDLWLDGNSANQSAGNYDVVNYENTGYDNGQAFPSLGDPNHSMLRVSIVNGKRHGVYFGGAYQQSQLTGVLVSDCDSNSFYLAAPDIHLNGCISRRAGLDGFLIAGNSNRLLGCKSFLSGRLDATHGSGFNVANVSRIDMTHVEAQDNRQHGYSLNNTVQTVLIGRADRNGLGPEPVTGYQGDGLFCSGVTSSRIDLVAGDRNTGTLMQRWAYNCSTGNNGNIVNIESGASASGTYGNGSFGQASVLTLTHGGVVIPQPVQARPVNAQTGTTYTLALTDAGGIVEVANAAAVTVTIPTDTTAAFPIGTEIEIAQTGAGQITFASGGSGAVTLATRASAYKVAGQYGTAVVRKRAANSWIISGDIAP